MQANDIREDLIADMDQWLADVADGPIVGPGQLIVDEIDEVYPGGVEQFLHEHR